ncbi:unnamed protein product [Penicillium salamii]|nr:unnamed protein product [Penicillium salamii]
MRNKCQVIVVGGSIAGLTFAHCLDHAGIDYIILEKQKNPEERIGATITVAPNGARILDQLGIYDAVQEVSELTRLAHLGYPDGSVFSQHWPRDIEQRLGYPFSVMTRQQLIDLLKAKLKNEAKIHFGKKVVSIHTEKSEAWVRTEDGSTYTGDLVVGADGVHSITRSEMWRIASLERPVLIHGDMTRMFADYRCVFGISDPVPGIIPGEQIMRCHNGVSIFVIGGKYGLIGWCVIQKLDRRHHYPKIPRYTQTDAASLCQQFRSLPIQNHLKFGDIWERRKTAVMSTLVEGLLKTWHYGRIVCIGDSVNKTTPTLAQGANMAIESAASLGNHLHDLFKTNRNQSPPVEEIMKTLEAFSRNGRFRSTCMSWMCHVGTRIFAREGIFYTLFGRYIALRSDFMIGIWFSAIMGAGITLDYIILERNHHDGFKTQNWVHLIGFLGVLLCSIGIYWTVTDSFDTWNPLN